MTSKEGIKAVISNWRADKKWIFGTTNPFLVKSFEAHQNPVMQGEFLFIFEILDNTHLIDDKLESYSSTMSFSTYGFSNVNANPKGDVERLKAELEDFTQNCINEYEGKIQAYKLQGKKIVTSNPLEW